MKLLVIKNGKCQTDIGLLIDEIDPKIKIRIVCSKNIDYKTLNIDQYDGVIILGGSQRLSNPKEFEEHQYLSVLIEHIRNWIEKEVNILGVCLGAQLVGIALGHDVISCNRLICGYDQPIELTDSGSIDKIFSYNFRLFRPYYLSLHHDKIAIRENGKNLNILATMGDIPYAFKYKSAYGVQFHPDITLRVLKTFCSEFNYDQSLIEEGNKIKNSAKIANIILLIYWIRTILNPNSDSWDSSDLSHSDSSF